MGRHKKEIVIDNILDRRKSGYYSTPKIVADFISYEMLKLNPFGKNVLDPCVGKEELLDTFYNNNKVIYSFDIIDFGNHKKSIFRNEDFIEYYNNLKTPLLFSNNQDKINYDYIIANPPYNCHEVDYIKNNKKYLLEIFSEIGVSNLYSMFLYAIIDIAKEGTLIGIITLDSFLTSYAHKTLREKILTTCSIHHLILCPTDLFLDQNADVRTCIIILQKGKKYQKEILTMNRSDNKKDFYQKLINKEFIEVDINDFVLTNERDNREIIIDVPKDIINLFHFDRLGELFSCLTGISTGDDKKYISKEKNDTFIFPFYKNPGTRRFYTEPDGFLHKDFIKLGEKISNFIVRNKNFLFKEGITCSSMGVSFGACYLPPNSTFGVNANIICDNEDIWWLLAYLNSRLVTYFVRGILIRSNMITSGYVSRIPLLPFNEDVKNKLSQISKFAYNNKIKNDKLLESISEIDLIIFNWLNLSDNIIKHINDFCSNLIKRT
ncbi:MAG: DNA methyltransferase [Spirochaetes bacterium GWD1_27_9]|nr:MAG: DNA methyltransferase [Spirochaetes bacterium GWB1_27_13]OHD26793.1 MAG: DNA methyltransferase [Spirochaetes bacterium GWC1_27_15]OHD33609.1 MAG: DNA methyltransferase [Spirochaetes bacterium GWD1_27_9]